MFYRVGLFIIGIFFSIYTTFFDDSNKIIMLFLSFMLLLLIGETAKTYKDNTNRKQFFLNIVMIVATLIFYSFIMYKCFSQYQRTKIIIEEVKKSKGLYYNGKEVEESDILKNDIYRILNVFNSREKAYRSYEPPETYLETSNGYKIEFTFIYRSQKLCMIHIYTEKKKPLIISSEFSRTSFCEILLDQRIEN